MGKLDLYHIQATEIYGDNLKEEHNIVAGEDEVREIFRILSEPTIIMPPRACFVYGFGSQPKSVYRKLIKSESDNYSVLWHGYGGPRKLKFLSYLTAACSGLIAVRKMDYVRILMETLSHRAMAGIFFLSPDASQDFVKDILGHLNDLNAGPEIFVKRDPGFFYFIIDGDTYDEEKEGFLCKMAFGNECPEYLSKMHEFSNQRW